MFITGPQVIKAATGEEVTLEELGGAEAHSEKAVDLQLRILECFRQIRTLFKLFAGQ